MCRLRSSSHLLLDLGTLHDGRVSVFAVCCVYCPKSTEESMDVIGLISAPGKSHLAADVLGQETLAYGAGTAVVVTEVTDINNLQPWYCVA